MEKHENMNKLQLDKKIRIKDGDNCLMLIFFTFYMYIIILF